jgi:Spy/CpxP family protein refolding chaperone
MKTIIAAALALASISAHAYDDPNQIGPMYKPNGSWNSKACKYGADSMRQHCLTQQQRAEIDKVTPTTLAEANERYASKRIQSIPGICVGDDCNRIYKIQHWDARTGQMTN